MERIGIGITTHNRPDIYKKTYEQIKKFTPNAKIVVVDDASDVPCPQSTFRFETNVGIAQAKNKCLELLDDCDHIFLFDDDCYPIDDEWWKPYIQSKEPHLMYIFQDFATGRKLNDTKILYEGDNLIGYSHPRGCMLYFDRKVLDIVGGYDISYGKWGFEHGDISNRIYNNQLTSFRYGDIPNSNQIIYSQDEHELAQGTISSEVRRELLPINKKIYEQNYLSKNYCQYKQARNIILTSYFVKHKDPQRNKTWQADQLGLEPLIESCKNHQLIILNDCFDMEDSEHVKYVRVDTKINPYFQRWLSQYQYLRDHPEIDNVFCVDATDVKLLNNPFDNIVKNILYVGDEESKIGCLWMSKHFPKIIRLLDQNETLLNCGVVGGDRQTVMSLCHDIPRYYFDDPKHTGVMEMGIFNYLCYTKYNIEHGRHITTRFKHYEETNAFFKHK